MGANDDLGEVLCIVRLDRREPLGFIVTGLLSAIISIAIVLAIKRKQLDGGWILALVISVPVSLYAIVGFISLRRTRYAYAFHQHGVRRVEDRIPALVIRYDQVQELRFLSIYHARMLAARDEVMQLKDGNGAILRVYDRQARKVLYDQHTQLAAMNIMIAAKMVIRWTETLIRTGAVDWTMGFKIEREKLSKDGESYLFSEIKLDVAFGRCTVRHGADEQKLAVFAVSVPNFLPGLILLQRRGVEVRERW